MIKKSPLIQVNSRIVNEIIIISVKDNGEGISSDVLEHAGQEFYTTKAKGTGLGLTICYSLVHKMGGSVDMMSKRGQGCEIIISLPVNQIKIENHRKISIGKG